MFHPDCTLVCTGGAFHFNYDYSVTLTTHCQVYAPNGTIVEKRDSYGHRIPEGRWRAGQNLHELLGEALRGHYAYRGLTVPADFETRHRHVIPLNGTPADLLPSVEHLSSAETENACPPDSPPASPSTPPATP